MWRRERLCSTHSKYHFPSTNNKPDYRPTRETPLSAALSPHFLLVTQSHLTILNQLPQLQLITLIRLITILLLTLWFWKICLPIYISLFIIATSTIIITESWLHDGITDGLLDPQALCNVFRSDTTHCRDDSICVLISNCLPVIAIYSNFLSDLISDINTVSNDRIYRPDIVCIYLVSLSSNRCLKTFI